MTVLKRSLVALGVTVTVLLGIWFLQEPDCGMWPDRPTCRPVGWVTETVTECSERDFSPTAERHYSDWLGEADGFEFWHCSDI